MTTRRTFLFTGALTLSGTALPALRLMAAPRRFVGLPAAFARLERGAKGRLGVAVLDTATGEGTGYRASERFAMCSTFKMLLAAAILQRVDAKRESLGRDVIIPYAGVLPNSPVTRLHAGKTMVMRDVCFALVTQSDNTAANVLLDVLGGPSGITRFAQSLGDSVTRLDRTETSLNEAKPGDPRDTTSPEAMLADWRKLLLGDALSPASRKQLTDWLVANQTGNDRLRAGLPAGWKVGDKTGSNAENTTNDVAIVWPAGRPPVLIAAYLTASPGTEAKRNAVLAQVARLVSAAIQKG